MTHEEMTKFVNENISLVPVVMKSRFEKMDIEKQYTSMLLYVERNKKKQEEQSMNPITTRVKKLFESKRVTIGEAETVIEYCKNYISLRREHELETINNEIQRLIECKKHLEEDM